MAERRMFSKKVISSDSICDALKSIHRFFAGLKKPRFVMP